MRPRRQRQPPNLVFTGSASPATAPTTPVNAHAARDSPISFHSRHHDSDLAPSSATIAPTNHCDPPFSAPLKSPTFPIVPREDHPTWRPREDFSPVHNIYHPPRPRLRTSMSSSSLPNRRRSPYSDESMFEVGPNGRPSLRLPRRIASDLHENDVMRDSQNSAQLSSSSLERVSGTEGSSVLTKSSSITDMSPDTPDPLHGHDDDMTVEDAIGMYMDDVADVSDPSPPAAQGLNGLAVIAEADPLTTKHATPDIALHEPRTGSRTQEVHLPENSHSTIDASGHESKTESQATNVDLPENLHTTTVATLHETTTGNDSQNADLPENSDESRQTDESVDEPVDESSTVSGLAMDGTTDSKDEGVAEPAVQPPPAVATPEPAPSSNLTVVDTPTSEKRNPPPSPRQSVIVRIPGEVPPPFLPGTDGRDRYGFRKASHYVSLSQFESWNSQYSSFVEVRRQKWVELLESAGLPTQSPVTFPPRSNKIKRYVRKGIPSEYRGAAWFYYAGGFEHMHRNPGHYAELVRKAMSSPRNNDKEHIERDLYRTFPDNIHFKPDLPPEMGEANGNQRVIVETEIIRSLRRVLYAFTLHNPGIGYTQSLNFITGMLLLFLPEEQAFWMLHIITSEFIPGTHEISLEGANVDLWILMVLLKESFPSIYAKIAGSSTSNRSKPPVMTVSTRLPDITLGLTNWLMSLYVGSLPLETTLRVWDCLFYEGSKTFFRVALGIFKASEKDIAAVSDPVEVFQIVQTVPKKLLDANMLLEESMSRRYRVGQRRIDALRAERREAIRREKTRLSLLTNKLLTENEPPPERPATRSGARSPLPKLRQAFR
ncbi:hypothetical protein VTN31DRAFT_1250 [Thermomyces dupontii]|uniref:uncharacterized protein n=1 Tax=Talaromyces thermophilus TaxID=28565 RepID=UPI0037427523